MKVTDQDPATDEQNEEIVQLGERGIRKALKELKLNRAGAQQVIDTEGEFSLSMYNEANKSLQDLSRRFRYRVDSSTTLPFPSYESLYRAKSIDEQVSDLRSMCYEFRMAQAPDLDKIAYLGDLPDGAQGWLVFPNIWKPKPILKGSYNDIVMRINECHSSLKGVLKLKYRSKRVHQRTRVERDWRKISERQGHPDFLVIAGQTERFINRLSVNGEYESICDSGQIAFGSYVVSILRQTHRERFDRAFHQSIVCSGDVIVDEDTGMYLSSDFPSYISCGEYHMEYRLIDGFSDDGWRVAPSGFIPQ